MKLLITGLHPVTGSWVTLQELQNDVVLTDDEISKAVKQYADIVKEMTKQEPSTGVQMHLSAPGRTIVFDPRKFLAVVVSIK